MSVEILKRSTAEGVTAITQDTYLHPEVQQSESGIYLYVLLALISFSDYLTARPMHLVCETYSVRSL